MTAPAQVRINEFMAANTSAYADPQGDYDDWIELYNAGTAPVDIGGWYITDNLGAPTKHRIATGSPAQTTIPARGYLILWADEEVADGPRHLNFKLNADGEAIGLFAPDGSTPVDTLTFESQQPNVSYGRFPDGDPLEWRFFMPATPGAANTGGFPGRVADPQFSPPRGFYSASFLLTLSTATSGAQIFYTDDGSEPTQTSILYSGPIPITGTTIIRARAYRTGWLPSAIVTHTYLFHQSTLNQPALPPGFPANWCPSSSVSYTIPGDYQVDPDIVTSPSYSGSLIRALTQVPSLSIAMPVSSWFGYSTGLISNSDRADSQGWERACSAELLYADGRPGFAVLCGVRLIGGTSPDIIAGPPPRHKVPKHSLRLLFKDEFGPTRLELNEPLFTSSPLRSFNTLVLDARMNMTWHYSGTVSPAYQRERAEYIRDQFMNDMQNQLDFPSPHGFYAHVFLNGLYWGLYCIHERPDEHFLADYWGGTPDLYDVLKHTSSTVIAGSNTGYLAMFSLARAGLANQTNYQTLVTQYLDLDPFINYMVLNFWAGNEDWAHQNWYCGRNRTDGSLFRYYSWDAEHVLKGETYNSVTKNDRHGPTELHQLLRQNTEYRVRFGDRAHKLLRNNGLFSPSWATALFNARVNEIYDAIIMESARWGDHALDLGLDTRLFTRDGFWIPEINRIRTTYFGGRVNTVISQLRSNGVYPPTEAPTFRINGVSQHGGPIASGAILTMTNPNSSGTIYYTLDGTDPRQPVTGAISPTAVNYSTTPPPPLTDTTWVRARVRGTGGSWSALNDAVYRLANSNYGALRITEIMYNPAPPPAGSPWTGEDFEFVEIQNTASHTLDLSRVAFTQGIHFRFNNSDIKEAHLLAAGQYMVVAKNVRAFRSRYGNSISVAGQYVGSLDNTGERLRLTGPDGRTIVDLEYNDAREWPQAADGAGHSLVALPAALAGQPLGLGDYGPNWRASTFIHGSPGAADPPIPASAPNGVLLNEFAASTVHTPAPPHSNDWIELYNPTAADIVLTHCYLSDDIQNLAKWQIPNGTVIPAGGRLSFDEITHFNNPVGFGLDRSGERVVLSYLPGTGGDRVLDEIRFKAQENGVTLGRQPDGAVTSGPAVASWRPMPPTRGNPNAPPFRLPVINQFMYHPDDHSTTGEYVELLNPTTQSIPLWNAAGTWRLSGGVDFQFPTTVTLPAGGYVLILPFNPADTAALNAFKAKYGVGAFTSQLFGPWSGNLSNRTERLALERPQPPTTAGEGLSWAIVDETFYFHRWPYPTSPDGGGHALHRIAANASGADPTNWAAAPPVLVHSGIAAPLLINRPASGITHNAATLNGEITSTGGENPVVRIYWGLVDGGTTAGAWERMENLGVRGLGVFAAPISGLSPATTYYFRAYAQNFAGGTWAATSAYFVTGNPPPSLPTVTHSAATNISYTSATLNGNLISTGGENPAVRFYWGTTDGGKVAGNWANTRNLGTRGTGPFSADITGLTQNTRYYYQVSAANSAGTAWADASGSFMTLGPPPVVPPGIATQAPTNVTHNSATLNGQVTSTGGENPTVRVYWGPTAGGQVPANWANVVNLGVRPAGAVSANVSGLNPNTVYYYRYYAQNSAGGTWAATTANFTTDSPPIVPPTVTVAPATQITHNSATVGGSVVSTGGENPSVRIYWGTTDGGTTAGNWQQMQLLGPRGAGDFSAGLTGLNQNQRYYYRVFAQNSAGGVWSAAETFVTRLAPSAPARRWHLY
ncbi:MAG: lamin tail domain-containing protein [Candidatus Sumerlaeia bacterium]|nr:lamin tail domain-containing protein [Candidatus Sumerlaeia bacterium]